MKKQNFIDKKFFYAQRHDATSYRQFGILSLQLLGCIKPAKTLTSAPRLGW